MIAAVASIQAWGSTMNEVRERADYILKNAWRWPLVWAWVAVIGLSIAASVGMMVRETVTMHIERQLSVAKEQINMLEAQAEVLKVQNINSMDDRAYIHQQVDSNAKAAAHFGTEINAIRDALKRLEARSK